MQWARESTGVPSFGVIINDDRENFPTRLGVLCEGEIPKILSIHAWPFLGNRIRTFEPKWHSQEFQNFFCFKTFSNFFLTKLKKGDSQYQDRTETLCFIGYRK
jgi:hypothetical protein